MLSTIVLKFIGWIFVPRIIFISTSIIKHLPHKQHYKAVRKNEIKHTICFEKLTVHLGRPNIPTKIVKDSYKEMYKKS